MTRPRFIHVAIALAALVALTSVATVAFAVGASSSGAPAAKRQDLAGTKDPVGGQGRTLSLYRVTIPVGVSLALHRHPGTQVARIEKGTLTYMVRDGSVTVMSGDFGASKVVRKIDAGQTGKIRAGQWIVEQPTTIHMAANKGSKRVVILLTSLFENGSPPSIPVT